MEEVQYIMREMGSNYNAVITTVAYTIAGLALVGAAILGVAGYREYRRYNKKESHTGCFILEEPINFNE